ncbi:MAG TPA: DNA helicase [Crenotrichaceae bacterium]|nr:DNA helicase [Crenotrichaceae bacterium]
MQFRISDTFTDSLAKLSGDEQKSTKTTAFDLQLNPANPGFRFHKLDRARDKDFWSVRVNRDIRIIVHKTEASLLLCYVDHHDKAYQWAERRKLETHPKTGAAQLVEVRELVREITVPKYVTDTSESVASSAQTTSRLFKQFTDEELLEFGVPSEWLQDVRIANEDSLLDLADHLPAEAAEALLEIATGGTPSVVQTVASDTDPFAHPDAQRRFRTMNNVEELKRALNAPWEKWMTFLHPSQQNLVTKQYNGPAKVSGSAGTGKTIVALHRAVFLAKENPDARILLTTFSDTLANVLKGKLKLFIGNQPHLAERLEVHAMDTIALRLHRSNAEKRHLIDDNQLFDVISNLVNQASDLKFSKAFVFDEWSQVIDAWQISSWEDYRDVKRLGRKSRLGEPQRKKLWSVFEQINQVLKSKKFVTIAGVYSELTINLSVKTNQPFNYIIVDESQDISIPQLRFLAAMGGGQANALFFAGDSGQRIFQQPFSWKSMGVDIRGRSTTLRVNYRTSHQIRMQADRLLAPTVVDVDGNREDRSGTISVFNGPSPAIERFDNSAEEITSVAEWLKSLVKEGFQAHEIAIFIRSEREVERAQHAFTQAGMSFKQLDQTIQMKYGTATLSTMHLAKGLEFRAVAVMACDDEIIPSLQRLETVTDSSELEAIYDTERHLLYVACTRARDRLMITSGDMPSEFLDDMIRQV